MHSASYLLLYSVCASCADKLLNAIANARSSALFWQVLDASAPAATAIIIGRCGNNKTVWQHRIVCSYIRLNSIDFECSSNEGSTKYRHTDTRCRLSWSNFERCRRIRASGIGQRKTNEGQLSQFKFNKLMYYVQEVTSRTRLAMIHIYMAIGRGANWTKCLYFSGEENISKRQLPQKVKYLVQIY